MSNFNDHAFEGVWKHCGKRWKCWFSSQAKIEFIIWTAFIYFVVCKFRTSPKFRRLEHHRVKRKKNLSLVLCIFSLSKRGLFATWITILKNQSPAEVDFWNHWRKRKTMQVMKRKKKKSKTKKKKNNNNNNKKKKQKNKQKKKKKRMVFFRKKYLL